MLRRPRRALRWRGAARGGEGGEEGAGGGGGVQVGMKRPPWTTGACRWNRVNRLVYVVGRLLRTTGLLYLRLPQANRADTVYAG